MGPGLRGNWVRRKWVCARECGRGDRPRGDDADGVAARRRRGNRGGAARVTETVDFAAVWSAATDLLNDEIVSQQRPPPARNEHDRPAARRWQRCRQSAASSAHSGCVRAIPRPDQRHRGQQAEPLEPAQVAVARGVDRASGRAWWSGSTTRRSPWRPAPWRAACASGDAGVAPSGVIQTKWRAPTRSAARSSRQAARPLSSSTVARGLVARAAGQVDDRVDAAQRVAPAARDRRGRRSPAGPARARARGGAGRERGSARGSRSR